MAKKGKGKGKGSKGGKKTTPKPKPRASTKGKPRTPAQQAATARMLAANAKKKGGGSHSGSHHKGGGGGHSTAMTKPRVAAASRTTKDGTRTDIAYAMENNIGWMEGIVGGLTGITWAFAADITIRLLGSHALTAPTTPPAQGQQVVYSDAPAVGQQYNWVSVDAPMNWKQWAVGGSVFVVVPILLARFAFDPGLGRSTMQFMAFGGIIVVGGRGATQLGAFVLRKTGIGQRIYAPQINAQQASKLLDAAIKADPKFQMAPMNAIPAAAGMTLNPPQPGVAGGPEQQQRELEAQRRAAGVGGAPQQQHAAPPPPPPPPEDDDVPPQRAGVGNGAPPTRQEQRTNVAPMYSTALRDRWRSRRAVA